MRYLVIGSGGREHAILDALRRGQADAELYCAPGNAGTAELATNVPLSTTQTGGIVDFARQKRIDVTIVGPEAPLVAGLTDAMRHAGLRVLGPSKAAAQLEGSKIFAKRFMRRHNIPTGDFKAFNNLVSLERALEHASYPVVLKADGLAAGKGVSICQDRDSALAAATEIMVERRFGEAGDQILLEQHLEGTEVSVFCLTDGKTLLMLPTARDYKPAFDGDQGPNTGGMGAVSPSPALAQETLREIEERILVPVIHGMQIEESPYSGILYAGLMLTPNHGAKVLEFNCRLGDPETQAVLPRLRSDLGALIEAAVDGRLDQCEPEWDPRPAVAVVMASPGYPEAPRTGHVIRGLDRTLASDRAVFHAGTRRHAGQVITSGGRVLCASALGDDVDGARRAAYDMLDSIRFEGAQCRSDIGI